MSPRDLLVSVLSALWNLIDNHSYLLFILGVAVIVIVGKLLKATIKTIIKGVGIALVAFLVMQLLGISFGG